MTTQGKALVIKERMRKWENLRPYLVALAEEHSRGNAGKRLRGKSAQSSVIISNDDSLNDKTYESLVR